MKKKLLENKNLFVDKYLVDTTVCFTDLDPSKKMIIFESS